MCISHPAPRPLARAFVAPQPLTRARASLPPLWPCADLAPLYQHICTELGWEVDAAQLEGMKARNAQKLQELDEKIKDAEENLGETEVRDAVQAKADYFSQIGDREAAAKAYQETETKTASVATKTDLVFNQIRCAPRPAIMVQGGLGRC